MILPKVRDPRLITIRRGGTLTDADHRRLALWAAACAEHVLHLFEDEQGWDPRPREAIEAARAWAREEMSMTDARARGGHAMCAARALHGAPRYAAYSAGQAACVSHVAEHDLGAAAYSLAPTPSKPCAQRIPASRSLAGPSATGNAVSSTRGSGHWSSRTRRNEVRSAGLPSPTDVTVRFCRDRS